MKYILFLFPLLFVSCKQECDIPATSTEEQFTVQKCTDGIRDSWNYSNIKRWGKRIFP
jgi:hypothetical protein